jgi:tetratricopeptide (TPR) repeat protein
MAWKKFPYPESAFEYTAATLKHAWHTLHAGDAEPWPHDGVLVDAWIDFHAGRFEAAARAGLDAGIAGYPVANKATCVHAVYLDPSASSKCARLKQVADRCTQQQAQQPDNAAAFYWHAYALGRYAQEISVVKALAQGIGGQVKASLERTLALAPRHADAHVALGVYHADIIDKVGALLGGLTYGASRDQAMEHFRTALRLNPGSAITRVEYARAMVMLDGQRQSGAAIALCEEAAALAPAVAWEGLGVVRARDELGG